MKRKALWIIFATMAIIIGLYPSLYFLLDKKFGLLSTKDPQLFKNFYWNIAFYTHIVFGGIALLIGWSQFSEKIRTKHLTIHRKIGVVYVIAAILSSIASLYIAFYATGGVIPSMGFFCLGIIWCLTTALAFLSVKKGLIDVHQNMMIYSYASCFAAVTLRIWLPILVLMCNEFILAYQIVAWLCWVPNLLIAMMIVRNIKKQRKVGQEI